MQILSIHRHNAIINRSSFPGAIIKFPALGSLALYGLFLGLPNWVYATPQDDDFLRRCQSPGVVNCVGFDNETSDILRGVNLFPDSNGVYRGNLDTTLKTSGNGALRFDLPPPPHGGANIAGRWSPEVSQGAPSYAMGFNTFRQNSTFYIQYRTRFDENFIANTKTSWGIPWKNAIFHQNSASCAGIELTTQVRGTSLAWNIYDRCGVGIATGPQDLNYKTWDPPFRIQNTDFDCNYPNYGEPDCFIYPTSEWITFYWKVQLGRWDIPESRIEVWAATESSPNYRKLLEVNNWPATCNNDCGPGSTEGYNNITLTPYMTSLSSSAGLPGLTSRLWYDELIVSTQPIAAPGVALPASNPTPMPPSDLTVQ